MLACTSSDDDNLSIYEGDCDQDSVVNAQLYENARTDDFQINEISVVDNCLLLSLSASGCSGEAWDMQLIDSGNVLESFPPQRMLRFVFTNPEDCEALITKEISFDLAILQVEGNQVNLSIEQINGLVAYFY